MITRLLAAAPEGNRSPAADDDYWYQPLDTMTASGVNINPDSAMRISAVHSCAGLIAETLAILPIQIMLRVLNGNEHEPSNDIDFLLRVKPNPWQNAYEFKVLLTYHLALRGNAYAEIIPGLRGFADRLEPLHPDCVRVVEGENGKTAYKYQKDSTSPERTILQHEMFHLRLYSPDGREGWSPIKLHREGIGLHAASQMYAAFLYGNYASPTGVIETDKSLDDDSYKNISESWKAAHQGVRNAGKVAILEQGAKFNAVTMSPNDAQYVEFQNLTIEDIARIYHIPLHMISHTSKESSWGSGIEAMSRGFVTFTLATWLANWTNKIDESLLLGDEERFSRFDFSKLIQADIEKRYQSHAIALTNRFKTRNEVRREEGLNDVEGGDEFAEPTNASPAATM